MIAATAPAPTAAPIAQNRRVSYPPLAAPSAPPSMTPAPMAQNAAALPSVDIPAPPASGTIRSAKGEFRTDPAAPPTAAQASDSFTFDDLLDIVNPLQHIPLVNIAYRQLSGDTIKPAETVAGGFLFGGSLGGMAAIALSMVDELWKGSAISDGAGPATVPAAIAGTNKFGGSAAPGALA